MPANDAILWVDAIFLGAAIAWALAVAYSRSPDYALLRLLFWAIAIGIGIFVLMWDVTATQSTWVRLPVAALIFAIAGTSLVEGLRWTYRAVASNQSEELIPPSLFDAQLKEIQTIDEFIGRKNEIELRDTFDFPDMLRFNILLARKDLSPDLVKGEESGAPRT